MHTARVSEHTMHATLLYHMSKDIASFIAESLQKQVCLVENLNRWWSVIFWYSTTVCIFKNHI